MKNKILEDRTDQTNKNNIIDVCSILEKCTIDEISKYLLKQGRKKAFPDITARQKFKNEKIEYCNNWSRKYRKLFI